jgi:hypothetical protein
MSFGQTGINGKFKTLNIRLDRLGGIFNIRRSLLLEILRKILQNLLGFLQIRKRQHGLKLIIAATMGRESRIMLDIG